MGAEEDEVRRFKQPGLLLALMIVSLTLLGAQVENWVNHSIKNRVNSGQPAHILLLGVDARPGETRARTDTIILASADRELGRAVLLSIPRDTHIAYHGNIRKINMVNQLKGPEAACREVERLLNVDVDHYVLTNFQGFENVVDILGGVDLEVEFDLYSARNNTYLKKGQQHLNGKQALLYARFRGTVDADIGRTARQQKLMLAIYQQFMRMETIPQLPELVQQIRENVETNISPGDFLFLAQLAHSIKEENIVTQTLPGYHYVDPYSGASYWEIDPQVARSIIPSLFWGHHYDVYENTPRWKQGW